MKTTLFLNDETVQAKLLLQVSAAFVLTRSAACYTRIEPLSRSVAGRPESEFGASRFAPSFLVLCAAKARAICLRDAPLGPLCTGAELCPGASAEILCHAESGR